jgi:hypothetical protein
MHFMRRSFAEDSPSFAPGTRNPVRHPYTKIPATTAPSSAIQPTHGK